MNEWLTPQSLMAIAALLTAFAGAVFQFMKERRAAPIDREVAQAATFSTVSTANKAAVDSFMELAQERRDEIDRLEKSLDKERRKVSIWESWYILLVTKWAELRNVEVPPARPEYEKEA